MKQKILIIAVFILFIFIVYTPDFSTPTYKDTSNWAFTMEKIVVNGDNLGSYHSLQKGTLQISGSIWSFSKDADSTDSPEPIIIEIYERKDWWIDRRVGTIKLTPSSTLDEKLFFEESFGEQPASDKYYFHVTRFNGNDDGWNIKGLGAIEIINNK